MNAESSGVCGVKKKWVGEDRWNSGHAEVFQSCQQCHPVRAPLSLARKDWLQHTQQDGHSQWHNGVRDGTASLMWRKLSGTRAKANEVSRLAKYPHAGCQPWGQLDFTFPSTWNVLQVPKWTEGHQARGSLLKPWVHSKKSTFLLPKSCFFFCPSKTLIPETQIYQGLDDWGPAEVLVFQTEEEKKTKWSEAALSNFLPSLTLALILALSLSVPSPLLSFLLQRYRDQNVPMINIICQGRSCPLKEVTAIQHYAGQTQPSHLWPEYRESKGIPSCYNFKAVILTFFLPVSQLFNGWHPCKSKWLKTPFQEKSC